MNRRASHFQFQVSGCKTFWYFVEKTRLFGGLEEQMRTAVKQISITPHALISREIRKQEVQDELYWRSAGEPLGSCVRSQISAAPSCGDKRLGCIFVVFVMITGQIPDPRNTRSE